MKRKKDTGSGKQANYLYISDIFRPKMSHISEVTVPYNRLI